MKVGDRCETEFGEGLEGLERVEGGGRRNVSTDTADRSHKAKVRRMSGRRFRIRQHFSLFINCGRMLKTISRGSNW